MQNSNSSNIVQLIRPYTQIKIIKRKKSRNNRNCSSSINTDKPKNKFKFVKSEISINKNNTCLKSISVNKKIPRIKNRVNFLLTDYDYHFSYNYTPNIKENSYNIISINETRSNKEKKLYQKQITNNFLNNRLRRKIILSADLNNSTPDNCFIHFRDFSGNIFEKPIIYNCITTNNDEENITYENTNNNLLNQMSNGAKSNSINKNQKNNSLIVSKKNSFINKLYINNLKNNTLFLKNENEKTIYNIHNKSRKSPFHNNISINMTNHKYINTCAKYKYPYKLYIDNSSNNLASSYYSCKCENNNVNNDNDNSKCVNLKNSCHFLKNYSSFNSTTANYKTNKNYNSSQIININNDHKITIKIMNFINEMKQNLKENKSNTKYKKYQILKNIFGKLIKFLENYVFKGNNNLICVFLQKILIAYHEIINAFNEENKKVKQINLKFNEKFEKMQKENLDYIKKLKEKQKEIDTLKKKINNLLNNEKINKENYNFNKIDVRKILDLGKKENGNKSINSNYNNVQYKKVFNLNKNNLDDLASLYFFDKILMEKHNTPPSKHIPKLFLKNLKGHK